MRFRGSVRVGLGLGLEFGLQVNKVRVGLGL